MSEINALRKIQDVCSLDICHVSLNIYLKVFFLHSKAILTTDGEEKKAEKEILRFITEKVGEKKTGKNYQSNS